MTNKIIEEILDYGYDGEGIAKNNGKVIFVPYTLVGEKVLVETAVERSSFCRGKVNKILEESKERQTPPCPYFGVCGGCAYQHTSYQNELEIKAHLLSNQLKKVGIDKEVEIVLSPCEYSYRNKIRLFVGKAGLALKERASGKLCYIDKCLLVSEEINRVIQIVNSFIKSLNLFSVYKEVVIREEKGNMIVNFILSRKKSEVDYQGLLLRLGSNCGIYESFNNVLYHKLGLKLLDSEELGLKCHFSPLSFHQVNRFLPDKLYQSAIENITGDTVVNCYSGAGVLSGVISLAGKRVIGIELGKAEHQDAERLKEENSLFYLTNYNGDCAEVLPRICERVDTIIVDPPRSGMDKKVIDTLNKTAFKRLIYISCNSATLVRDLSRLENLSANKVSLFDMFARTGEYETLVVMEKL